jgi:phenylalanyl-tRNA synthetase beta chain
MKFSENWLRELVNPPVDREGLVERLTMAGLEVEDVAVVGGALDGIVVGEIVEATPHPESSRLKVCKVEAGQGRTLSIVCGAPNARAGLKAPLAGVGSILPDGRAIAAADLRGVKSEGMLCSALELGLSDEAGELMELPAELATGAPLAQALHLPDASLELKLTPDRPDCLGLHGLARDLAAQFRLPFTAPAIDAVPAVGTRTFPVHLTAGAGCPRYCGRVVEGIDVTAATPLWMAERLRRAGLRPISPVVDVANYVMLELGQPLHGFDLARLQDGIEVRRARAGEPIKLLDEREVNLDSEFLVIADASGPVAVAGIMGGFDSRVTETTRDVFLESAHFDPATIMGRARRLGMHTDAAHRFERGVDPELPRRALERATALLVELAGGRPGPLVETVLKDELPVRSPVSLRRERLARVLGMQVPDDEVEGIFAALGMQVEPTAAGWSVRAPSSRFDIELEEDLIEEVVRIHGYDRLPTRAPAGELPRPDWSERRVAPRDLRQRMAARGYSEALCFAFVGAELLERWGMNADLVPLANALSADLAIMRPSLLPGLVEAVRRNRNRQIARVRLFEIGRSFHAAAEAGAAPIEIARLAAVVQGDAVPEQWGDKRRGLDFFDVKGDLEALAGLAGAEIEWRPANVDWLHRGRSAEVWRSGARIGWIGNLDPRLAAALDVDPETFVFELELDPLARRELPQAGALSRYPSVRRDISVELNADVAWIRLESALKGALGPVLREILLFDEYRGPGLQEGCRSLAIGLILQDHSRTLTDQDVDALVAAALATLERDTGARLRG